MHCLFFNIASHQKTVALVGDSKVLAIHETGDPIGDHELIPLIEDVISKKFHDLDHIAAVIGPGGFTSLRIAVACANTLADQLQIPSTGVHLSDLLHAQSTEEDHFWIHATKKNEVFVRGFGAHQSLWPEPAHITIDELMEKLPNGAHWCGELLDDQVAELSSKELHLVDLYPINDILPEFLTSLQFDQELLLPWYGRGY